jgi:hypothetical protein
MNIQYINFEQIRPKGQLIEKPSQLSENDRTDTWSNIQATFDTLIDHITPYNIPELQSFTIWITE